ncbi:MAG TPA: hypothetical protein VF273_12700, partial [Pelobium sp.]
ISPCPLDPVFSLYFFPQKVTKTLGCALCYQVLAFMLAIRYRKGQGRFDGLLWSLLLYCGHFCFCFLPKFSFTFVSLNRVEEFFIN